MITDDSTCFSEYCVQKLSKSISNHQCFLHEISLMYSGLWNYLEDTLPGGSCSVSGESGGPLS